MSLSRISSASLYEANLSQILRKQASLVQTQNQLSTGKRVVTAADDPLGAGAAVAIDRSIASLQQFGSNANVVGNRLNLQESLLAEGGDALQRLRELAIQTSNATLTSKDRQSVAEEVRQIRARLVGLANSVDSAGRYLFGGTKDDVRPFVETATGIVYVGDQVQRSLEIAPELAVQDANPGSEVFMRIFAGDGRVRATAGQANTGTGLLGAFSVASAAAWATPAYPGQSTLTTTSFAAPTALDGINYDAFDISIGATVITVPATTATTVVGAQQGLLDNLAAAVTAAGIAGLSVDTAIAGQLVFRNSGATALTLTDGLNAELGGNRIIPGQATAGATSRLDASTFAAPTNPDGFNYDPFVITVDGLPVPVPGTTGATTPAEGRDLLAASIAAAINGAAIPNFSADASQPGSVLLRNTGTLPIAIVDGALGELGGDLTVAVPAGGTNQSAGWQIVFTGPGQYEVRDSAGAALDPPLTGAYTSGRPIEFFGLSLTLTGVPVAGDTFRLDPAPTQSLFTTVDRFVSALDRVATTAVERAQQQNLLAEVLADISSAGDHLIDVRAAGGARLASLDEAKELRDSADVTLRSTVSQIRDVNIAEAASRLQQQLTALEAAQLSFQRVAGLSLFNYLR